MCCVRVRCCGRVGWEVTRKDGLGALVSMCVPDGFPFSSKVLLPRIVLLLLKFARCFVCLRLEAKKQNRLWAAHLPTSSSTTSHHTVSTAFRHCGACVLLQGRGPGVQSAVLSKPSQRHPSLIPTSSLPPSLPPSPSQRPNKQNMPRAKAAPKRDAQALVQVSERPAGEEDLSDDEWIPPSTKARGGGGGGAGGAGGAGAGGAGAGGAGAAAAVASNKKPKQPKGEGEAGAGGGGGAKEDGDEEEEEEEREGKQQQQQQQQQKKKEKPAPGKTTTTYKENTTTFDFDPESIAAEYVAAADGGGGGTGQLGLTMHNQLLASARLDAVTREKIEGDIKVYGNTPGKRTTVTSTFKFNGKVFKDKVPLYEREEVVAVFAAILRKQSTKRR